MATYSLAGVVATGSSVTSLIDVSRLTSNEPPIDSGEVLGYDDPSSPTTGTVTSGIVDGLPNSPNGLFTPFLRTVFKSDLWSKSGGHSGVELIVPTGGGILEGDLMVAVVTVGSTSLPIFLTSGWTLQKSATKVAEPMNTSIWTRIATASEDGRTWTGLSGTVTTRVQVRVYGNAVFGQATITNNARGGSGETTTAAIDNADPHGLVMYAWTGNFGTTNSGLVSVTVPSPLVHPVVNVDVATFSAELTVSNPIQPARTATVVAVPGHSTLFFGTQFQTVITLLPLAVFRYAQVLLEEATGAAQDTVEASFIHLMGADEHSPQTEYGFAESGLNASATGTVYSYERWIRVRFDPTFNTARAIRFWAANLVDIPAGWSIQYGTTGTYSTPVNTASSIAVSDVPTSDPGQASPNAGGGARFAGIGTQYSDWIVLQASADVAVVGPGPVLGFSLEGTLIPIEYAFSWVET